MHLLWPLCPTPAVRLPRSSVFISSGRLHLQLGHPGVDPGIQRWPSAEIPHKVGPLERTRVPVRCLGAVALIAPFGWQIPMGSLSRFPVRWCDTSGGSLLHCHRPTARHHVQLFRQRAQHSGRERVRRRGRSTDHHHRGSVWSNHLVTLKALQMTSESTPSELLTPTWSSLFLKPLQKSQKPKNPQQMLTQWNRVSL